MNKKISVITIILIMLGAVAAVGVKLAPQFYQPELNLSKLLSSVKEFSIDNSMTIVRREGVWSSSDDDFYPVDNDVVEKLLETLRQTAVKAVPCTEHPSEPADIVLNADDEIKLFYDRDEVPAHYVTVMYGENCSVLTGNFNIPDQPYRWFKQPLLPLSNTDIEEISGIEPERFSFSGLVFYQASRDNSFEEWDQRKIKIVTVSGIVIEITIYARGHSYWASVSLQPTVMPTIKADSYIKNNGFLYDGWYFELPQPEGSRLFGNDSE